MLNVYKGKIKKTFVIISNDSSLKMNKEKVQLDKKAFDLIVSQKNMPPLASFESNKNIGLE